jgi:hypothetical protein
MLPAGILFEVFKKVFYSSKMKDWQSISNLIER